MKIYCYCNCVRLFLKDTTDKFDKRFRDNYFIYYVYINYNHEIKHIQIHNCLRSVIIQNFYI